MDYGLTIEGKRDGLSAEQAGEAAELLEEHARGFVAVLPGVQSAELRIGDRTISLAVPNGRRVGGAGGD